MSQKNILIIGGGILQVPLIQTAKQMGLGVVVTDLDPNAPGMTIADHPLVMSTRDIDGTVRTVRKFITSHPIHGVLTAGTDASMTVAAVANVLDLPGIKFSDAEAATNKIKMRTRFAENDVPSPLFFPAWTISEARMAADKLGFPLVIKPADNMGARGVVKVHKGEEVDAAYKHAKGNSPTGSVIVEEFMPGPELSVDSLVFDGEVYITGVADRIIEREPYFVETGHNMPSSLPQVHLDEAEAVMRKAIKALGITRGAAKGDLKLTPDGIKVGEIAARLSGGFMSSHTYPLSSGVNLYKAAIEIALGEKPKDLEPRHQRVSIERGILGSPGKLVAIEGLESIKALPNVSDIIITKKVGDQLQKLTSNVGKVGHLIITAEDLATAEATFQEAIQLLKLEIDDSQSLSQREINDNAKKRFGRAACWVCKVCDGVNCASSVPGMGGLGKMVSFQKNLTALSKYEIVPKYIREEVQPSTEYNFFGYRVDSPIWAAPITGVNTNMNGAIDETEYNELVCQGMFECSSLPFVGDGASPHKYKIGLGALETIGGRGVSIFKPRAEQEMLKTRFAAAEAAGILALGIDIDAVFFKTLALKNQPTKSYTPAELAEIRSWTKLPFILKGIMTVADAEIAFETGADAIIVSNHGGRVLDTMPGTASVLPEIAEYAASRPRPFYVYADGGIRSGEDAFKMIALGAEAVLVGRPFCINTVGGGKPGLKMLHNEYLDGLVRAMRLTGTGHLNDIQNTFLRKAEVS